MSHAGVDLHEFYISCLKTHLVKCFLILELQVTCLHAPCSSVSLWQHDSVTNSPIILLWTTFHNNQLLRTRNTPKDISFWGALSSCFRQNTFKINGLITSYLIYPTPPWQVESRKSMLLTSPVSGFIAVVVWCVYILCLFVFMLLIPNQLNKTLKRTSSKGFLNFLFFYLFIL